MKPYIMNYSAESEIKASTFTYCPQKQLNLFPNGEKVVLKSIFGPTGVTESLEPTDPDELEMMGTIITHTVEPVDPDEFLFGGTIQTRTLEPNDPDEIVL